MIRMKIAGYEVEFDAPPWIEGPGADEVRILRGCPQTGYWLHVMSRAEYERTGGRMIVAEGAGDDARGT